MIIRLSILLSVMLCAGMATAQQFGVDLEKEKELYKATKQVGQFFHRFNAEENPRGERMYEGDTHYRDAEYRRRYLDMMMDDKIDKNLKSEFITEITKKSPFFIDFHKPGWFAEVKASFTYYGKQEDFTLFLTIQQELVGSKWVITNLYNKELYKLFEADTGIWNKFIHPMSHELDFMNLGKVFKEQDITPYLKREFQPDYLTILAYEHKRGNLKFETITHVKFHFLQVPEWYFEINNVYKDPDHSGWMITQLMKISDTEKEAYIKLIIRDKDQH